ncbi:MAG: carbohydrate ABC transporter permease [Lacisediminihabitans sp.]
MSTTGVQRISSKLPRKKVNRSEHFWIAVAPALILVVGLLIYPISQVIGYSFTNFDGFTGVSNFIGVANYLKLVSDPTVHQAIVHTLIYSFFYIVVQLLVAFSLAVALSARLRGSALYRSIYFIPVVVSPVAVVFAWSFMFDPGAGSINTLLRAMGLGAFAQNWLGNYDLVLYSVIAVDIWRNLGFFIVIFVAGLSTIPSEILEAGKVDGANAWQSLIHITIPQMRLTFGLVIVLALNGALRAFDTVFLMTQGGPGNQTELYMTKTFKEAFSNQHFGYGSAMAVVVLLLLLIVASIQQRLMNKEQG